MLKKIVLAATIIFIIIMTGIFSCSQNDKQGSIGEKNNARAFTEKQEKEGTYIWIL